MKNFEFYLQYLKRGDISKVAEVVGCSVESVKKLIHGDRGVRQTPLQLLIKDVVKEVATQNMNLEKFAQAKKKQYLDSK